MEAATKLKLQYIWKNLIRFSEIAKDAFKLLNRLNKLSQPKTLSLHIQHLEGEHD